MNIEAFLLCDAATDQQGKLNVLGAFDNIWAKKLPARHPACSVALRMSFEKLEEGDHPVKIQIIDYDGQNVGPKLEGMVSVRIPPDIDSTTTNFILNIQGLELKKYGKYRVDFAIDGQIMSHCSFYVRELPK